MGRQIGNESIAEDVLQATFMQLHLKCGQFEEGRKVRPWLYRIAMNQAIDSKRRNRRHENVSLNQSTSSVDGQSYELVEMVRGECPLPEETLQVDEQRQSVEENNKKEEIHKERIERKKKSEQKKRKTKKRVLKRKKWGKE